MIRRQHLNFNALPDEEFDSPLGEDTGASLIFGTTGGVMEAALRTANDWLTGKDSTEIDFHAVRGAESIKEATVEINGTPIKVAVASGTKAANEIMKKIASGEADWTFVEVMGCPGGCVTGGGQPIHPQYVRDTVDIRGLRAKALYDADQASVIRKSHQSPVVKAIYEEYYKDTYGCHKAHHDLHTTYVPQKKFF